MADVPLDILCLIINDPDKYHPLIQGWRDAKDEAVRERQRSDERGRVADQKEAAAAARLEAAEKCDAEQNKREAELAELDHSLAARATAVGAQEREASAREIEVASREAAAEEKVKRLRGDLAALREL